MLENAPLEKLANPTTPGGGKVEPKEDNWSFLDDRTPCEDCWMGEYKETGYRYCGNNKCPARPGAGN